MPGWASPIRREVIVGSGRGSGRWAAPLVLTAGLLVFVALPGDLAGQITESNIATLGEYAPPGEVSFDSGPSLPGIFGRLGLALALVIGLIYGLTRLAKKYMPAQIVGGRRGPIEVLSVKSLAPRKSLVLVRIQDKTILLGLTPQNVSFLSDIDQGRGGWEEAATQSGLTAIATAEGNDET